MITLGPASAATAITTEKTRNQGCDSPKITALVLPGARRPVGFHTIRQSDSARRVTKFPWITSHVAVMRSRHRLCRQRRQPVLETCRSEARVVAWGQALIIHRDAVVERLGIGDDRPCVPGCVQELPHELIFEDEGVHVAGGDGIRWDHERLRGGATIGLGRALLSRLIDGIQWNVLAVNTHRPLFWFLGRGDVKAMDDLRGRRLAIDGLSAM